MPSVLTATFSHPFFFFFLNCLIWKALNYDFSPHSGLQQVCFWLLPFSTSVCHHSWQQCEVFSLCFILILEVKWPSCTSGSNRWQRPCSLVVPGCDENRRPHKKKEKLLRSGFVCKYKSVQKREPETVSDVECFHSAVLDMDYIFF